ncbi:MAG: 5'-methylthioadenosine/S-adenosylhomocysteine nucleosidase [Oceanospirillaceae bacterium]|nr:5'-methylthioadenosine/S-adenosylhomocysteine nucleosidase [Oceanospirillaceae bacterium]
MAKLQSLSAVIEQNKQLKVGIIGAMEQEIAILRDALVDRSEYQLAGFDIYTGKLQEVEVVLLQSGIGKVNASVSTALMLQQFSPDCVINTGSAGGCDDSLEVGDIVISSELLHHDVDVTAFGYALGQMARMPETYIPDELLADIAKSCIESISGARVVRGVIATGDTFVSDPAKVALIKQLFPQVKAVEMEAAAIAQTCYLFNTPFLVVRALSDIAGKSSNLSFADFIEKASTHSANMVQAIVAKLAVR